MVTKVIEKHKEKITHDIPKNKNRGKRAWQHIDTLKNKDKNPKNKIKIYINTGKIIPEEKLD